jgi:EAL domain-containing protein (putative c-di-GMP-specific phosphodiesterase class I)
LHSLKALGVQVAIDDFGTGYSSLAYLQRFPVDILKIDKSFVDHVSRDGHGQSISRMIITLAETLGLRTVAEGIVDAEQANALASMGCEMAQGYYYCTPLGPNELVHRIRGANQPGTLGGAARPVLSHAADLVSAA